MPPPTITAKKTTPCLPGHVPLVADLVGILLESLAYGGHSDDHAVPMAQYTAAKDTAAGRLHLKNTLMPIPR